MGTNKQKKSMSPHRISFGFLCMPLFTTAVLVSCFFLHRELKMLPSAYSTKQIVKYALLYKLFRNLQGLTAFMDSLV